MDDIFHEFILDIEEILGSRTSEEQREEIIESLWLIFQQKKMKIINEYKNNAQVPCINLCLLPFSSSIPFVQPPILQSPMMQAQMVQPLMMQQPMIQQPMMQQPMIQQPMMQQPMIQQPMMQLSPYPNYDYFYSQQFDQQSHKSKKKDKKEKDKKGKGKKHEKTNKKGKDKKHEKTNKKRKVTLKEMEFNPKPGMNFNGIMRYLTNQTGGNIHDNGTVEITSNSISGSGHPKNLVNYQDDSRYQCVMNGSGGAYICFDFKDMLIQLSNYTIQSNNCIGQNWYDLRNWVIQVSDDGNKWEEIDRHSDDPALNGQNIIHTFNVQKPNNGFHRYVRLLQTGKTWSQSSDPYHFFFPYIEFYGKIKIPESLIKK